MVEPKHQIKAYVPASTLRAVVAILMDTKTGRVKHGAVSSLVTKLLEDWLEETRKKHANAKRRIA